LLSSKYLQHNWIVAIGLTFKTNNRQVNQPIN